MRLTQVSTSFFSITPLLSCIQGMTSVPLAEELVHGTPPGLSEIMSETEVHEVSCRMPRAAHNSNLNQNVQFLSST